MKKIYICGKVSGDPDYADKFIQEEFRLGAFGYLPVNPARIVDECEPWPSAMRAVIREMLLCGGVSLLPDWTESKGAKIEARLARELGMDVRDSEKWDGVD